MVFDDKMHDILGVLETDGIILYPTDTVWALGCSIKSSKAIRKIRKIKRSDQPMVILASDIKMLKKHVPHIHPRIETLLDFHDKPLTVVYPDPIKVSPLLSADDRSIAIRIPDDEFCQTMIDLLGHPIVSTIPMRKEIKHTINYEDLTDEVISSATYTCYHRRNILSNALPSVMVKYNAEGELEFLRC